MAGVAGAVEGEVAQDGELGLDAVQPGAVGWRSTPERRSTVHWARRRAGEIRQLQAAAPR
ncbi:hypothetical protein OG306_21510 [Streptomyces sp. NBC_01241]|nr:hypothetical protein OG306_21510 [Streptomyces sp. NBC_01241]